VVDTVTDIYTVTDIATETDISYATSEFVVTDTVTAIQTSTVLETETDTVTDDVAYTSTNFESDTVTDTTTDTLTAFFTTTTYPPLAVKRGEAIKKPGFLSKWDDKSLSQACSCLHVEPSTINVVTTTVLPPVTVCEQSAVLRLFTFLTKSP
jgi:hypothetical protein